MILYKNQALQKIGLYVASRSSGGGLANVGASLSVIISKDGAAFASLADGTITDRGNGLYFVNLSQAETNADLIVVTATSTNPDAVVRPIEITTANTMPDVNVAQISGDSAAADSLELFFDSTLGTGTVDGYNILEALRLVLAFAAAKASGANGGASTIVFRDAADTKDRITMTVDTNGNRTSITLNGT